MKCAPVHFSRRRQHARKHCSHRDRVNGHCQSRLATGRDAESFQQADMLSRTVLLHGTLPRMPITSQGCEP
jgi:hypothetical protein